MTSIFGELQLADFLGPPSSNVVSLAAKRMTSGLKSALRRLTILWSADFSPHFLLIRKALAGDRLSQENRELELTQKREKSRVR